MVHGLGWNGMGLDGILISAETFGIATSIFDYGDILALIQP